MTPNFFLVGAPKAGTTAFVRYLEQHPQIFVSPIKEPSFFAPEVANFGTAVRGLVLEWDQYLKLFKGVRNEIAIGEATVAYLGSEGAAAAIRARVPQARILMMLRDPADRLQSHWAAARAAGVTTGSFADWLDEQVELERLRVPRLGAVWSGFYARHLERYLRYFPAPQIKIVFYDDYVRDPHLVLRDVFAFLGVDTSWVSDVSRRYNVTLVPRWPRLHRLTWPVRHAARFALPEPIMNRMREWWRRPFRPIVSSEERGKAIAIYRDDIQALAALLHRDLSSWLQ